MDINSIMVNKETWVLALTIINNHTKTQVFKYLPINITNLDKFYELLSVRERFSLIDSIDFEIAKLYINELNLYESDGLSYTKINSLKRLIKGD